MSNIDDKNDNSNKPLNWRDYFQRGINKQVLNNLRNTTLIIENDEKFANLHWFNEMTRSEVLKNGHDQFYLIDDIYFISSQEYIQNEYPLRTIGIENIRNAIIKNCHLHKFHPVRDSLTALKWDQKGRICDWTIKYLGAENNPYNCAVGAMFIISMVARVFQPGCKCDHMMVLEGEQGIGKSTVCKILFGEYFSDHLPDIGSKDAYDHVSKFWGIEIAEMHVFNRSETAALKSFISRTHEQYRPPYGRMEVQWPRQCVFMGTTNQELYLKDETGGRRFWPVKCGYIDLDGLKRDRDQLLAEAVYCFNQGWNWWPDRAFEVQYIKPQQDDRLDIDPWQSLILFNTPAVTLPDRKNVSTAQIYQTILGAAGKLPSTIESARIGKILRLLRCPSRRTKHGMVYNLEGIKTPKLDEE